MTARGHTRGHAIEYHGEWLYSDDLTAINIERPCKKCGRLPTIEGHDACLGFIPGCSSACCGHGVSDGYVLGA